MYMFNANTPTSHPLLTLYSVVAQFDIDEVSSVRFTTMDYL